jgi:MerR family transcriptional regulator/heat shock protein HspR
MADDDRALYIISVAAELAGVHPQTLRIYERKGLLEPQRTPGGSRRYSQREIELLQRIQELTNGGLSIAGVKLVLDLETRLEETRAKLDEARDDLERARREAHDAIDRARREQRRDLVPLRNTSVVLRQPRRGR